MPRARKRDVVPQCTTAQDPSTTPNLIALSLKEVVRRTGLSRAFIYQLIAAGEFPAPAKVGRKSIWDGREIERWLEARFAARRLA